MENIPTLTDGYHLHYGHYTFYYGGDDHYYRTIFASIGVHIYDVVLLAFHSLAYNACVDYIEEFTRLCYTINPNAGLTRHHHRAATNIYFSVKYHLRDKIGINPNTLQLRRFNIDYYVCGKNKYSMSIFIRCYE